MRRGWIDLSSLSCCALLAAAGCYSGSPAVDDAGTGGSDETGGVVPTGGGEAESGSEGESGEPPVEECASISLSASPLRRLTRAQYDHTIQDLLGVDQVPTDALASLDAKVGTFDSNIVVPLTALGVASLTDIAEQIAGVADLTLVAPCDPNALSPDAPELATCVESFVRDFGARALRHPLTAEEQARYLGVYESTLALESETPATAMRQVVATMLQSPYFLYQVELGAAVPDARGWAPLTDHELAARLSYFLWSSMPDDELRAAADAGALKDDAQLLAQVERMLADDRARRGIGAFVTQWLELDHLDWTEKASHPLVPELTPDLREAMKREAIDFMTAVMRDDDGRLETLLTAPYSLVPPELYPLYGLPSPQEPVEPGTPVQLDPARRAGLLTQVGWLTTHANPGQSSPVLRGVVVLESLLCTYLPAPPNDIKPPPPDPNATTRERFEVHTSVESCQGCHQFIDGIGFGFEGYDALGVYRSLENGLPVDESGILRGYGATDQEFVGPVELAKLLASEDSVRDCVAFQWTTYALGRTLGTTDACQVDDLKARFAGNDGDMRALVADIVTSPAFRTLVIATP